jgi:hypothetical protein
MWYPEESEANASPLVIELHPVPFWVVIGKKCVLPS